MKPFYLFLMVLWGALAFYTGTAVAEYGWNFFPYFLADLAQWSWPGQFNLDFLILLFLSASWIAWRNGFSVSGVALAVIAVVAGSGFLLPYLTYLAWQQDGDTAAVLLGRNAKERMT